LGQVLSDPIRRSRVTRRITDDRREELLDGVAGIISDRGFADVPVSDLARDLGCSLTSLYKIARNKDSLMALAIARWGDITLEEAEARATEGTTASDRARAYYRTGVERVARLSHALRRDVERFESTRLAYRAISDRFVDRFTDLIDEAAQEGEIRSVNARFMAGLFRHVAAAVRDEDLLESAGLSAAEALLQIDGIIWEGLRTGTRKARSNRV
jgi:AcrR family transcriptional regulator